MTTFKDIAINDTFSFPGYPAGWAIARLGLCVKVSARRYAEIGKSTIHTIGTTKCEVVARGELETVTAIAYRGDKKLLA
jgi:hypothetical protein